MESKNIALILLPNYTKLWVEYLWTSFILNFWLLHEWFYEIYRFWLQILNADLIRNYESKCGKQIFSCTSYGETALRNHVLSSDKNL